ncbi:MAG: hypothetical protein A2Y92_01725 [Chloroflexi bacterium RBG_13_57_8]|nr:MAG: hypothetical protein A2Y92_01725 [Chloroflexi bacterium RBG_13_57_8]
MIKRAITARCQRLAAGLLNYYRYQLLSLPSKGDRVACPFCGRDYRKLLAYGLDTAVVKNGQVIIPGRRPGAQCPRCFSLERERFLWLYLRERTTLLDAKKSAGWRVLHLAPERNLRKALSSYDHLEYISADLRSPLAMVRTDITLTGFPDNIFDVIICSHVLEHVPDDIRAITELYRMLKPGGRAFLQVPVFSSLEKTFEDAAVTAPEERVKAFGHPDHVRIYGRDFTDRLAKAGLQVETFRFDEATVRKYGLFPDEDIYIGTRQ